jgi:hypothetical protein
MNRCENWLHQAAAVPADLANAVSDLDDRLRVLDAL